MFNATNDHYFFLQCQLRRCASECEPVSWGLIRKLLLFIWKTTLFIPSILIYHGNRLEMSLHAAFITKNLQKRDQLHIFGLSK
jgi:hypothetical protein